MQIKMYGKPKPPFTDSRCTMAIKERQGQNRSFLSRSPALPHIKRLGWTKTHDKTFVVLGGFWHSAA